MSKCEIHFLELTTTHDITLLLQHITYLLTYIASIILHRQYK